MYVFPVCGETEKEDKWAWESKPKKENKKNEGWGGLERHNSTPTLFKMVTWSLERGLFIVNAEQCGVTLLHTCSSPSLFFCLFFVFHS